MERHNLDRAIHLVREIEHLENVLVYIEKHKEYKEWGSPYSVRFTNELSYNFPVGIAYSMFDNVLVSSIENDLENLKNKLKEL